ncbi:MAG: YjzC family protein [Clostridiales bacterium]|nr:YjzC family protein [Clostridiales bacterium]
MKPKFFCKKNIYVRYTFSSAAHTIGVNGGIVMRYNSGETAPKTGSYKVVNENGREVNRVYLNEGDTFPPTSCSQCHYED